MELGIFSFVDNTALPETGRSLSPAGRLSNLMEEIELADQLGLDVFGIGEHHREEYVASAPPVLLAAAAVKTRQIRLTSAVTVLSSDDPVRVYQQFATVDLLSKGRAEIMVGRGSFIESYPLFGYDLRKYDELFTEKLELLLTIMEGNPVRWKGETRAAIENLGIYPRAYQDRMPVWIAVGGTPQSAYRAGYLGLPMALAIIGGEPARFKSMSDLHRRGAEDARRERMNSGSGYDPANEDGTRNEKRTSGSDMETDYEFPALSINSHGFIAGQSKDARDMAYPAYKVTMDKIGRERGWPPMTRDQFEASCSLKGANFVGSPQEVIDKILYQYEIFEHKRFMIQMSVGSLPHREMLKSIELFGTKVAPEVRKYTSQHPDKV